MGRGRARASLPRSENNSQVGPYQLGRAGSDHATGGGEEKDLGHTNSQGWLTVRAGKKRPNAFTPLLPEDSWAFWGL